MKDEAMKAIFSHTIRRMTLSTKVIFFALLVILPWIMVLFLRLLIAAGSIKVSLGGVTLYSVLILTDVMSFMVPVLTLYFGTSLIADDVEAGTLPYLFGRPVRRAKIYLTRYTAMVFVLTVGTWLSVGGSYVLAMAGSRNFHRELGTLLGDLVVAGLSVLVYGALFSLLGLVLRKPLFWSFLIGFGWENMVGWLPGFLKRFTLLFHLHTLLPNPPGPTGIFQNMMASSESRFAAVVFLGVYLALFLLTACFVIQRREAPATEKGGG